MKQLSTMKLWLAFLFVTMILGCSTAPIDINKPQRLPNATVVEPETMSTALLDLTEPTQRYSVYEYWAVTKRPQFVTPIAAYGQSGCVAMTYIINKSGQPDSIIVTFSYPDDTFDLPAKVALSQRRWGPTQKNSLRQPVKTSAIVMLGVKNEEIDPNCAHLR